MSAWTRAGSFLEGSLMKPASVFFGVLNDPSLPIVSMVVAREFMVINSHYMANSKLQG